MVLPERGGEDSLVPPGLGEDELGVDPPVGGLSRVLVGIVLELHYQLRTPTKKGKTKRKQNETKRKIT